MLLLKSHILKEKNKADVKFNNVSVYNQNYPNSTKGETKNQTEKICTKVVT